MQTEPRSGIAICSQTFCFFIFFYSFLSSPSSFRCSLSLFTSAVFSSSSSCLISLATSPFHSVLNFPLSPTPLSPNPSLSLLLPLTRWLLPAILCSALIFSRKSVGSWGPLAAAQGFVRDGKHCRRRGWAIRGGWWGGKIGNEGLSEEVGDEIRAGRIVGM